LSGAAGSVYLDNIFFKSQHLIFGNPSDALYTPNNPNLYRENYLLEKPQFVVSYSDKLKTPNWVSWQLNKSWLGSGRNDSWRADSTLPNSWYAVPDSAYNSKAIGSGNNFDNYDLLGNLLDESPQAPDRISIAAYERGHLASNADRNRNTKDNGATFVFSNAFPQHPKLNDGNGAWNRLEDSLQRQANFGKEFYIIAGVYGTKRQTILGNSNNVENIKIPLQSDGKSIPGEKFINVPEYFWKVVLETESLFRMREM
jgi:DNA/RNA endonuclease G (NUC1)